eukprot:SAG11_NODE_501_length_8895_cov_12.129832_6_plen_150_part_00
MFRLRFVARPLCGYCCALPQPGPPRQALHDSHLLLAVAKASHPRIGANCMLSRCEVGLLTSRLALFVHAAGTRRSLGQANAIAAELDDGPLGPSSPCYCRLNPYVGGHCPIVLQLPHDYPFKPPRLELRRSSVRGPFGCADACTGNGLA